MLNCRRALERAFCLCTSFTESGDIVCVVLVIPVNSAAAKRKFSSMKCFKNFLRSTMMGQLLQNLGVISVERYACDILMLLLMNLPLKSGEYYNIILIKMNSFQFSMESSITYSNKHC